MKQDFSLRAADKRQTGDTIVEVLIAIVVASSMLVGAFIVSNHSTRAVRDAEEHSQALSVAQGQLEALRAAVVNGANGGDHATWGSFCMHKDTLQEVQITDPANLPSGCKQQGPGELYNVRIDRKPVLGTPTFSIETMWDSITGGVSQAKVQLFYRAYSS